MATASEPGGYFPFLALPVELRHAVYRYVLMTRSRQVIIYSNSLEGRSVLKMKFCTVNDLSLLETNRQIRIEAGNAFYAEGIFTLHSYPRTQEYRQEPFYGKKTFHISIHRVHLCHLLTPKGTEPETHLDCLKGAQGLRILLQGFVEAMAGGHCMRYLLIESYQLERAVFFEDQTMQCDITHILEPLETLQGIELYHIRAVKKCLWPYLRFLEKEIMKSHRKPLDQGEPTRPVLERALQRKEALKSAGLNTVFGDPKVSHRIFEIFDIKPLYQDLVFLKKYKDDILT